MCSIAAGLLGASAFLGYRQQVQQAETQSNALKAQAEADEQNAKVEGRKQEQIADNYANESKQLRSRQRLAQGAQRAQAGAAGVDFSGSQMDLLSSSMDAYKNDQATLLSNQRNDNYNSRVVQTNYLNDASQKRTAADNIVSSAKSQWLPTLLSTAASIAGMPGNSSSSSTSSTVDTSGAMGNATRVWGANIVNQNSNFRSGANRGYTLTSSKTKNYW